MYRESIYKYHTTLLQKWMSLSFVSNRLKPELYILDPQNVLAEWYPIVSAFVFKFFPSPVCSRLKVLLKKNFLLNWPKNKNL